MKSLEASTETALDGDEYLDAFVFLGGEPNKEGTIQKELLIGVIKEEFGLTIDMVVSACADLAGVSAEDRGQRRGDQLLPVLRAARRRHERQPLAGEQLPEQQGLLVHALQLLREQHGQAAVLSSGAVMNAW